MLACSAVVRPARSPSSTTTSRLCVLEDVLTRAEKTLVGAGNTDQVHATRIAFQDAVRDDFIAIVEEATGRKVRAFVSQVHIDPELAAELFLFEPMEVTSGDHELPDSADE